jgi:hypothetical protein
VSTCLRGYPLKADIEFLAFARLPAKRPVAPSTPSQDMGKVQRQDPFLARNLDLSHHDRVRWRGSILSDPLPDRLEQESAPISPTDRQMKGTEGALGYSTFKA